MAGKPTFCTALKVCSEGMVGPCIPFSLTAVSRDSRRTVRKGSHYYYSRLARLQPTHKQSLLLSPPVSLHLCITHKQHLSHPLVCPGMQSFLLTDGDSKRLL